MTPEERARLLLGGDPASLARGLVAGLGSEYRQATGDEVRAVAERLRATASELANIAAERDRAADRGEP